MSSLLAHKKRFSLLGRAKFDDDSEINRVCPAITPTVGAELLADPGLEANYTAGKCDTFTTISGAPTVAQSADVHGGAKAQSFLATAQNNRVETAPLIGPTVAAGDWVQCSAWAKRTAGAFGGCQVRTSDTATFVNSTITEANYTQRQHIRRLAAASISWRIQETFAAFDTVIVDDLSIKKLTFSSCFTLLGNHPLNGSYWFAPTIAANSQGGLAMGSADFSNLLLFYIDRVSGNLILDQYSAGVITNLRSGAIAYVAGQIPRLYVNYPTAKLYYNGAQIGLDATITAALATLGTKVYGFNTLAGNAIGEVHTSAQVNP